MNVRSIILVLAALLVAGGTAFVARGLLTGPAQAPRPEARQEQPGKKVLVAKVDLPAGTFIKEEDVTWQKWPPDGVNDAYMVQGQVDLATVVGAVVRRGIVEGQPITEPQIARPGDRGFLAAVLTPGMRAVTVKVKDETSVAGLVFPGDRVDILLLQKMPKIDGDQAEGSDTGGYAPRTAETFLENVRVLAAERRLNDLKGEPKSIDSVTIELLPKQVEMLAAIRDIGELSLSLRGLAKPDQGAAGPQVAMANGSAPITGVAFLNETVPGAGKSATPAADGTSTSTRMTAYEENEKPVLGTTSTYDVEVSRTLSRRVLTEGIQVVRGSPSGVTEATE